MLAGIVVLVIGLVGSSRTMLGVGVVLASLGGLEVSIREHFAGYRSHTTLLAGVVFVLVAGGLAYLAQPIVLLACLIAGAVGFAVAFYLLRRAFQRASGGLSFKAGGLRG